MTATVPGLEAAPQLTNPFGLEVLASSGIQLIGVLIVPMLLVELLAAVSLIVRFRRSRGDERQQLKWLAYGVVVLVLVTAGEIVGVVPRELTFVGTIALAGALLIAVTRYRLYDIDRLVSRTVSYALVTAVSVAVYVASVVVLRATLTPLTGESDLAVAGSTLAVAAVFGPLRRRTQAFVDRRFARRRYDAVLAVEVFGQRLRDEVDVDAVVSQLRETVAATVQPATASLWLRPGS